MILLEILSPIFPAFFGSFSFFFFFQAEDGIRDADVTGVQTCALPICRNLQRARRHGHAGWAGPGRGGRSEEHTSELQSRPHLVCRLLLEKKICLNAGPPLRPRHGTPATVNSTIMRSPSLPDG